MKLIEGATLVTVLRHGQVQGRANVYRGDLDDPMTGQGMARVRRLADSLGVPPYRRIATSPRLRCLAFAQDYASELGLPLDVLPGFRELSFGAWEGLAPEAVAARFPEALRQFQTGAVAPPGGESVAQLRERVGEAWSAWLADAPEARGGHHLLVTHAGVMRALLMALIGLPADRAYRIALPEAANFQVSILPGEAPVLLALNPCVD